MNKQHYIHKKEHSATRRMKEPRLLITRVNTAKLSVKQKSTLQKNTYSAIPFTSNYKLNYVLFRITYT